MHQLNGQRRACRLQVTDGQDNYRNTIKIKTKINQRINERKDSENNMQLISDRILNIFLCGL